MRLFTRKTVILGVLILGGLFLLNNFSIAQETIKSTLNNSIDIKQIEQTNISTQDFNLTLWRSLQIFLEILGFIAVIINIYAGVKWMFARGNASQVEDAKKILLQGIIGLIIIFFSWSLITYLTSALNTVDSGASSTTNIPAQ